MLGGQASVHPVVVMLSRVNSSENQFLRGWKYSIKGSADISLDPVIASKASCQGLDSPNCIISLHKTLILT